MRLDVILINNLEENVHNLRLDIGSHGHELAVHTMQDGFQVVTLSGIFAIEQLKEAIDKGSTDAFDDHVVAQVGRQDELKKKLINELQVRPCFFQMGFVFIGIDI